MSGSTATRSVYEMVFERMPVAAVVLDRRRRVLRATAPLCGLLGVEEKSLTGRDFAEVVVADDPAWLSVDPVDHLGTPSIGRELEAKIGGKRRVLRVSLFPLEDGASPPGALLVLRDAKAKDRDLREAQAYQTSLEELCACIAHEIRNPLTGIRTTVQFVGSKLGSEHPSAEDLSEVLKEMDRIEQIIGDLLRFGRPAEVVKEAGNLNALVDRVLDGLEAKFAQAEVTVRRNLSEEVPHFPFGADSMQQVLLNLVHNAVEAMPEGGRITVTTSLRRFRSGRPPVVELFVSDTGHGVPPDLMVDVFKPFFTTRHNGTGLGLPISLAIVRAHGGRITVRNRVMGGATFRVVLPLPQQETEPS